MKVAVCNAQSHGRHFLTAANINGEQELGVFETRLSAESVQVVVGFSVVCAFAEVIRELLR